MYCKKCGNYYYRTMCECKEYTIIDEESEQHIVYATSEFGAAMRYAERSNFEGENYLVDNLVRIKVNGNPYDISARSDVIFKAARMD